MSIIDDAATFDRLSREQAVRLATTLSRILDASPLVDFDLSSPGEAQRDLLFELAFFAIAGFEDRGGIEDAGRKYFPRPAFEVQENYPVHFVTNLTLILGGSQIHSQVEDPVLDEALNRARN
jgi:hypothetical protein